MGVGGGHRGRCGRCGRRSDPPTGRDGGVGGGERLQEAEGGGVELFQAACIRLAFDHYIIAAHAAPAVHS